jgi:hypothetical protein
MVHPGELGVILVCDKMTHPRVKGDDVRRMNKYKIKERLNFYPRPSFSIIQTIQSRDR